VGKVGIALLLRDFQAEWESPAFGLFRGASFSTALLPTNCAKDPYFVVKARQGFAGSLPNVKLIEVKPSADVR